MLGLFAALFTVTASYSVGYIASAVVFKAGGRPNFGNTAYYITLGLGILSLVTLFTGVNGLVYPDIFWITLSILNVVSAYLFAVNLKQHPSRFIKPNVLETILACAIALTGLMLVVLSFRPVTNLDALCHMVLLPKSYILKHAVYNLTSYNPSYSYPQIVTMLDMIVISVSNEVAVNHLHLLMGFLVCALMYGSAKKTVNRTAGLLTVLTIMTSSVFFDMAPIAKIDIGVALFSAAAFYCLVNWREENSNAWFLLSAAFCGFAFGAKYNGGLVPVLPVVFYLYAFWENKNQSKEMITLALWSFLVFMACVSPWLALNYSYTHNPVSPFLATFFHDTSMTVSMRHLNEIYFSKASSGYLTYLKDVLLGMPVLFFAFLANFRKNKTAGFAFICGTLYFMLGSTFYLHADRIFFTAFILMDLAAACAVVRLLNTAKVAAKVTLLIVYFGMITYGIYAIGHEVMRRENLPFFCGAVTKDEFLRKNVTCYAISQAANKLVPAGEKIFSLSDPRGYYFNREYVQEFSTEGFSIITQGSQQDVLKAIQTAGIKYILYSSDDRFNTHQPPLFASSKFLDENFDLAAKEGDYSLYKTRS